MSSREPHWPVGPTASAGSRRSTRHSYQPHNKWMKMTTITSSSSTTTTTTNPRYVDAGVHFHLRFHRRSSGPSFQQRRRLGQQTSGPSSSPAATIIVIIKVTGWGRRAGGVVCGWVEGGGARGCLRVEPFSGSPVLVIIKIKLDNTGQKATVARAMCAALIISRRRRRCRFFFPLFFVSIFWVLMGEARGGRFYAFVSEGLLEGGQRRHLV